MEQFEEHFFKTVFISWVVVLPTTENSGKTLEFNFVQMSNVCFHNLRSSASNNKKTVEKPLNSTLCIYIKCLQYKLVTLYFKGCA